MEPGSFYHIYNRGNNHELIFREDENYRYFLQQYGRYLTPHVDTYAYCLMPDHFHFLVRVKEPQDYKSLGDFCSLPKHANNLAPLEKAFRDFFISYAKSFNKRYGRSGSLFQYKFKRKQADDMAYRMRLVVYIHANPVRARLCYNLQDWVYSSYRTILGKGETAVQRNSILQWFDGREGFIDFHRLYQDWEPDR